MYRNQMIHRLEESLSVNTKENQKYVRDLIKRIKSATVYHLGILPEDGILFKTFASDIHQRIKFEKQFTDTKFHELPDHLESLKTVNEFTMRQVNRFPKSFPETLLTTPIYLEFVVANHNLLKVFFSGQDLTSAEQPRLVRTKDELLYYSAVVWCESESLSKTESQTVLNILTLPSVRLVDGKLAGKNLSLLLPESIDQLPAVSWQKYFAAMLDIEIDRTISTNPQRVNEQLELLQQTSDHYDLGLTYQFHDKKFQWELVFSEDKSPVTGFGLSLLVQLMDHLVKVRLGEKEFSDFSLNDRKKIEGGLQVCDFLNLDTDAVVEKATRNFGLLPYQCTADRQFIKIASGYTRQKLIVQPDGFLMEVNSYLTKEVTSVFFQLLNCKNVVEERIRQVQKVNQLRSSRTRKTKHKPQQNDSYIVLKMVLPKTKVKYVGGKPVTAVADKTETVKISFRSGHFKTFTKEKPLFGKAVGTFWWQPIVKTNKEVVYDVAVNEKKAAEQLSLN